MAGGWKRQQEGSSSRRSLFICIQATVLTAILITTVYIGQPIYSQIWPGISRISDIRYVGREESPSTDASSGTNGTVVISQEDDLANRNASLGAELDGATAMPPPPEETLLIKRPIWEVPPSGTKMPDIPAFKLTKEMVDLYAKDNVIIVTFGNYAFMDFILNWVKHLTDIGVDNLLVGAMDTKLLEALYWKGVPVFDMGSNMDTSDVGWGTPKFHKMGREKVFLINALLPFGVELLMCDTDMVWLKNPLPYLARFPGADILTSSDQVAPSVTDDKLEDWRKAGAAYNIGIFHWRPTDASKKLAEEWKHILLSSDQLWDQNGFNDLTKMELGPSVDEETGLFYAYKKTIKLGILPVSIFCSGHTYFVQALYKKFNLEPYAVHTTFQFAGTIGKRHRLREGMLFYDPPEYYDSPGGFLSFDLEIPQDLLVGGPHTVQTHFALVNHQIKQVRTALAIALISNRILVMPPLWCRLDRLWFGHPGTLPGTFTQQPFLCPMDHIFEINHILENNPEAEFGPKIDFREYSFLQKPQVPDSVKSSRLEIHLCDAATAECEIVNSRMKPGKLGLPKLSNEETLQRVLSEHQHVKIVHFPSMTDAFGGFTDKLREEKFRKRVSRYTGIWCCIENKQLGHIYYDMFWDEKPDWKPAPPETQAENHPPYL